MMQLLKSNIFQSRILIATDGNVGLAEWIIDDLTQVLLHLFSVVGEKEQSNVTVNVRTRDNKVHGEKSVSDVIAKFQELAANRILKSEENWD